MSGFGGGGGSGGGGRNSQGGGRGRGRGRGRRSNNYHGSNYSSNHRSNTNSNHPQARLLPCKAWTTTGSCRNNNCNFAHVVKLHASIDASSVMPNDNGNNTHNNNNRYNSNNNATKAPVSSVAIWETQGAIKIFTGSKDGFWRLWNTQGGTFVKEFEHNMGGPVECLVVASNFLFCGFDSISPSLPEVNVGMIHAWNLATPTDPPLEFQMHALIPYAHAMAVSALLVVDGQKIVSGSQDGAIRLWSFDNANPGFILAQTLHGHAREVTGLSIVNDAVLWSSSIDGSIRIWDLANNGVCQYAITMATGASNSPPPPQPPGQPQQPPNSGGIGHTNAVTCLLSFQSPSGTFVLSSSLDGFVKAWNGSTGQCVASEAHGEGVVTMSLAIDSSNNQLLLIGLESGNIMVRNILQTPKMPAFSLLLTLSSHYTAGHEGAVKGICQGPAGTFYSAGTDGKVLVLQFDGDLGL